jgi:hypothetical protein
MVVNQLAGKTWHAHLILGLEKKIGFSQSDMWTNVSSTEAGNSIVLCYVGDDCLIFAKEEPAQGCCLS